MSPAIWALVAIFGSFVTSLSGAALVEFIARRRDRRRDRREAAAALAEQQHPATPELDAVDEHFATAAALLQPDALDADVAALIRQTEAHLRRAVGDTSDIPIIPGDQP